MRVCPCLWPAPSATASPAAPRSPARPPSNPRIHPDSHDFNSQRLRASSPRTIAWFHFKVPFESSNIPCAGANFLIELSKTGPAL